MTKCERVLGRSTVNGPPIYRARQGPIYARANVQEWLCDQDAEARNYNGEVVCGTHRYPGATPL